MHTARILSLRVDALRSCIVSSAYDGRLELVNPDLGTLGAQINGLDVRLQLYAELSEPELDASGTPTGRLKHDAEAISNRLSPVAPFAVGEAELGAQLQQWIGRRQSTWRARYQHINAVAALVANASHNRVLHLKAVRDSTMSFLAAAEVAYAAEGASVATVSRPTTVTENRITAVATRHAQTVQTHGGNETAAVVATHVNLTSLMIPSTYEKVDPLDPTKMAWVDRTDGEPTFLIQRSVSTAASEGFNSPLADARVRSAQMLADVEAQLLEDEVFALRIPYLQEMWANELLDIDCEIRKLQIAYIESYLFSPVTGQVAELYRKQGEYVRRGEAVFSVENARELALSGQLRTKFPVRVGDKVLVRTSDAFKDATRIDLAGQVTAVRGFDAQTDRWTVVLKCTNAAGLALPLGYEFEPDPTVTAVEIG